jgi:hypothetical protein
MSHMSNLFSPDDVRHEMLTRALAEAAASVAALENRRNVLAAENAKLRAALDSASQSCLLLAVNDQHRATERAMRALRAEWGWDQ